MKPFAIDLYAGLGGWTEGLQAEGYEVIGYDIEAHQYGDEQYPGELRLQDVLTLNGADLRHPDGRWPDLIVGSSPCQKYSYFAMPWSRAKAQAAEIRADESGDALRRLNELFEAQFRIQREASEAAGRHIPMVVENVRGAEPWVGRAAWSYGSFFLWGDVPALMPPVSGGRKNPGFRFDGSGKSFQTESVERHVAEGRKGAGAGAGAGADWFDGNLCVKSSKSPARKAASAKIAKIPFALSSHIGRVFRPAEGR